MSDFAKKLVYLPKLTIHMAAKECKVAMCISRLVDSELLSKLKFEQKKDTSLVKLVLSRRTSTSQQRAVPSQTCFSRTCRGGAR
jgi:hypothetical protein